MRIRATGFAAAVAALALCGGAQAQTFEETLAMAYRGNPALQAERARLRAVDEGVVQARAGGLPSVSAQGSVSATHTDNSAGSSDTSSQSYSLSASQPLYQGGRITASVDQAGANVMAARESLRGVEQTVLFGAAQAFMDVTRDSAVVEIRRNNVEVLLRQLEAARDRFEVGEITRTDVAQAEARLSGARAQLSAALSQLAASRANYERVVGQAPATLGPQPGLPPIPQSLDDAVEVALNRNPQFRAAGYAEEAARHSIRVAESALRPQVSLGGSASHGRDSAFGGGGSERYTASAQVSMPIFTGGLNRSRVRAAVHGADQARQQVNETRRQVTESVTAAWNAVLASNSVIESSRQAVRANEIALDGVEQEAFVGLRTTLDVLNAEQELLESRLSLVSAERDYFIAGMRLLQAMGRLEAAEMGLDVEVYDPGAYARERATGGWLPWN
ncbi:MAG: TolC family outer membrane protein [Maricaulaceae bacterium]|nr:TolC family outer membrane protein [Maricaulaceae bacterium]